MPVRDPKQELGGSDWPFAIPFVLAAAVLLMVIAL
jgi:hypothetical protein